MSSPGSPSLAIERRAGAEHALIAAVLLVLALVPWAISSLSSIAAATLSIGASSVAVVGFWRMGWLGGTRAISQAIWTGEGEWRLIDVRGRTSIASLQGSSWVAGSLVWLRFDGETGSRQMLLLGPGGNAESFRRLVARLRLSWSRQSQDGSTHP